MVAAAKAPRAGVGPILGCARPGRPAFFNIRLAAASRPDDVWRQQEHRSLTARELIRMAQTVRRRASASAE
ncbi:hypothetical protein Mnod_2314 [Methylobacterium nodulans ORS 2060]|uniref:Uncharacterized protein n=1 Tax=Methylobacterium nodulans (strain LMG 21967 / CNCM I-2342 / ORS 2060) TaxID=460265 RepID=B8IB75_METNO|nr:hypothetical protein Mnod_2314 [Methylobacterium nodulans ORS 2060]